MHSLLAQWNENVQKWVLHHNMYLYKIIMNRLIRRYPGHLLAPLQWPHAYAYWSDFWSLYAFLTSMNLLITYHATKAWLKQKQEHDNGPLKWNVKILVSLSLRSENLREFYFTANWSRSVTTQLPSFGVEWTAIHMEQFYIKSEPWLPNTHLWHDREKKPIYGCVGFFYFCPDTSCTGWLFKTWLL